MRRTRGEDWVFTVMEGVSPEEPRPHHHCLRCGARLVIGVPVRIDDYLDSAKAFIRRHAKCLDRAALQQVEGTK